MRKKISPDIGNNRRYLISFFALVIGSQMLVSGSYFGVVFIVIGFLVFKYMKSGGYVCFDEDCMFFVSTNQEKRVALKKIVKIKKPLFQVGNSNNNWEVFYKNNQGEVIKEKINISFYSSNFKEFKKLVKLHNPRAKVG